MAWRWLLRGRERRRDYANYIVRIGVSGLPPEHAIDMSTQRKQQAFVGTHAVDNIVQKHLGGVPRPLPMTRSCWSHAAGSRGRS